ncbi:methyl-accepting chemotaxis protein [Alteromonas sp. 1_MG-2023]|uniref:methyl-accepting chemotaxis protein n=1 Tax=Alteromonas sp. 1_MG-2023 TaxID=3062669 RepID=UPI0026E12148|nr:methyl-accepting chemotaxis protein [Alteromonas sp. 1_MG-2023]MDO6565725.1 methyl-accepting chemotaxis protein [Alteromonas sp. 1_MG-2023]
MFFKNKQLIEEVERLRKEVDSFHTVESELRAEMIYVELDSGGRITRVNDSFSDVMSYSSNHLSGKVLESIIPKGVMSQPATKEFLQAIKQTQHWHGAISLCNANDEERWFRGILQPIISEGGGVGRFALYMAEQTKNINRSREMNDMLEALNRSTAVIEFDLTGKILKANDNFLSAVGYSMEQIQGKHHKIFCPAEDVDTPEYKQFWSDLSQGKMFSDRFKRIDSRGNPLWLEASYNPIRNDQGALYKVVKFATVITEQMEQQFAISEAANVAFSISQGTGEQAQKGKEVVGSMVRIMGELTSQMGTASEGIRELDEQSQKVADLVKSISGIADQTNLLALNAAIEAARAGDQGRGFAVVADEVRQLASRTSTATEEIVSVVVENSKLTENAVQLIEAGQDKAREALEYSTESGKVMNEIQNGATEVVNAIGQFTQRL